MLSGEPIYIRGVGHVKSPKLKEINEIGQDAYTFIISYLSLDKERYFEHLKQCGARGSRFLSKVAEKDQLNIFDLMTFFEQERMALMAALSFFICEEIFWDGEKKHFGVRCENEQGIIDRQNYDEIRRAILRLNYINSDKCLKIKYSSDKAKSDWAKAESFLSRQKNKNEDESSLGNMVSKLCSMSGSYNLLNVYDLTIFQFCDQFAQCGYLHKNELNERIFTIYGGKKFKEDGWIKPIIL